VKLTDTLGYIVQKYPKSQLDNIVSKHLMLKKITIKELLTHTSGLHSAVNSKFFAREFAKDPYKIWSHKALINLSIRQKTYFRPGQKGKFHYTSVEYYLIGMVIEAATNHTVQYEMRKLIKKLKLKHTFVPDLTRKLPFSVWKNLAAGYVTPDQPEGWSPLMIAMLRKQFKPILLPGVRPVSGYNVTPIAIRYMYYSFPAGGMISTPSDVAKFYTLLFSGKLLGKVLTHKLLKGIQLPIGDIYGLGIWITNLPKYKMDFYYHGGDMPGYRAIAVFIPKYGAALVLMTNLETSHIDSIRKGITADIIKTILKNWASHKCLIATKRARG